MTPKKVLIAICAGLASATAAMAFLSKSFMALGFVYLASLPILMAGLAYGLTAAIIAVVVGTLITGMSGFPVMAGAFTIIYGLPALMIIQLIMMKHTVTPGNIMFPGSTWDKKIKEDKKKVERMLKNEVPLECIGSVQDIASIVVFIASEKAKFVNGANWVVDGGQTRS